jgi:hypothetical protein
LWRIGRAKLTIIIFKKMKEKEQGDGDSPLKYK